MCVLLAAVILIGALAIKVDAQHDEERDDAQKYHQMTVDACNRASGPAVEALCIAEAIEAYAEKNRSRRDLYAQEDMALYALIGAIFTGVGVVLLFLTWRETVQVTDETRRIGETQAQAYLICNTGKLRLRDYFSSTTYPTRWGLSANLAIANKGQSPARQVNITYDGWLMAEQIDRRGSSIGYFHGVGSTFCADVGPGDQETAIIEFDLLSDVEYQRFEQSSNWLTLSGEIVWINEFQSEQRQAFALASPKFRKADFYVDGEFRPATTIILAGIGQRKL